MPLTIPAFVQYQQPMFPLRGLWNRKPTEGDQFVNVELDWLTTTNGVGAVQFSLSGNSPVALSQIVALSVDNGRCGVDVDFIFPDSGFVLTVPAHHQGLFPVFTNALMFYASGVGAAAGDVTILQILNSLPPPLQIAPTQAQNHAGVAPIFLATVASTPIIPATVSGTLNAFQIGLDVSVSGSVQIALMDGHANTLWIGQFPDLVVGMTPIVLTGLNTRFFNGLNFSDTSPGGGITGTASVNVYYTAP